MPHWALPVAVNLTESESVGWHSPQPASEVHVFQVPVPESFKFCVPLELEADQLIIDNDHHDDISLALLLVVLRSRRCTRLPVCVPVCSARRGHGLGQGTGRSWTFIRHLHSGCHRRHFEVTGKT